VRKKGKKGVNPGKKKAPARKDWLLKTRESKEHGKTVRFQVTGGSRGGRTDLKRGNREILKKRR